MKKLITILTIVSLASCKTETQQTTQSDKNFIRIQSVDIKGDTTYSETKIAR